MIVAEDNTPLMASYNGPPAGFQHNELPCTEWCPRGRAGHFFENGGDLPDWAMDGRLGPQPDYSDCPSLHAEANALSRSNHIHRKGGTIYVTSDVCIPCSKLIANSGLVRVVVDRRAPRAYRDSHKSYEFLKKCGLTVVSIV